MEMARGAQRPAELQAAAPTRAAEPVPTASFTGAKLRTFEDLPACPRIQGAGERACLSQSAHVLGLVRQCEMKGLQRQPKKLLPFGCVRVLVRPREPTCDALSCSQDKLGRQPACSASSQAPHWSSLRGATARSNRTQRSSQFGGSQEKCWFWFAAANHAGPPYSLAGVFHASGFGTRTRERQAGARARRG